MLKVRRRALGGGEGALPGRPIHPTGSPVVFLLPSGTTIEDLALPIVQNEAGKILLT